jgi:hypothetical protein
MGGLTAYRQKPPLNFPDFVVERLAPASASLQSSREAVQQDANGEVVGLDYNRITPLLVEAVKAQEKVISELQKANRTLEASNRALEQRVVTIESAVAAAQQPRD